MNTYLWIEDRKEKSSYIFWQTLMEQLCPGVEVESKKNNSDLVKAVKALEDTENKYIVVFDNSFDNLQIAMEQKMLSFYILQDLKICKSKKQYFFDGYYLL